MRIEDAPDVLTVEEAGELLRIGRTAAYEACRRGDLPAVRIGRSLRVPRHALERLLNLNGHGPSDEGPNPPHDDDRAPTPGRVKEPPRTGAT